MEDEEDIRNLDIIGNMNMNNLNTNSSDTQLQQQQQQSEPIYGLNKNRKRKRKSTQSVFYNMDELLDVAAAQSRIKCFVPISRDVIFESKLDKFNATTIIHPFSTFRFLWDSFIMIILVFTCFEIPLTLAFSIETSNLNTTYGIFVLMIDVVLCTDILLNFRTAFYHKFDALALVANPKIIAKKYLKSWFIIDFITSFPFEFLIPHQYDLGGAPAILRAFRIVRLIRLFKLVRFFRMLKLVNTFLREFMGAKSTLFIRLTRLIAYMVLAAHFAACLWFYVGRINYNHPTKNSWLRVNNVNINNKGDAYLISMYWSIVTLFTTG